MRREGIKNYYYFGADTEAMSQLVQMITHAKSIMENLPDRSGENENWRKQQCKFTVVISLGYGKTQGTEHKSKSVDAVSNLGSDSPDWFQTDVEAALLAPTAMNQQKFMLALENGRISAKAGSGFYTKIDLGIVKYHFEIGAGKENFEC